MGEARLIVPAGEAWDSWFEGEGVSDDFAVERGQPADSPHPPGVCARAHCRGSVVCIHCWTLLAPKGEMSTTIPKAKFRDNLVPLRGCLDGTKLAGWTPGPLIRRGLGCIVHAVQVAAKRPPALKAFFSIEMCTDYSAGPLMELANITMPFAVVQKPGHFNLHQFGAYDLFENAAVPKGAIVVPGFDEVTNRILSYEATIDADIEFSGPISTRLNLEISLTPRPVLPRAGERLRFGSDSYVELSRVT